MKVSVELHRARFATVIWTPSLAERAIGKRQQQRCAELVGATWRWTDGSDIDETRVQRALDNARRDLIVAKATAPPS